MSQYWTVAEVAAHTRLSERTVRELIATGRLPVVRPMGVRAVRVPVDAVQALMARSAPAGTSANALKSTAGDVHQEGRA